jgi:hypothetical protein
MSVLYYHVKRWEAERTTAKISLRESQLKKESFKVNKSSSLNDGYDVGFNKRIVYRDGDGYDF